MSNTVALFDAVLNSFLQSFAPIADQHFHEFDIQISTRKYSNEELDSLLEKVFISFPRNDDNYIQMIDKLISFASTNSNFIIGHLCSKLNNEMSRGTESGPTIQIITLLTYRATNYHHFMFVHYLIMIIFSDLLLKIISRYPSTQFFDKISKIGYGLCTQSSRLNYLQDLLIETWSYIFYYASLNNPEMIIDEFRAKIDQDNPGKIIKLIRRIQGNQPISELILQSIIQVKKKKNLTSELILDLTFLLSRINCNIETLSEFFKIGWEIKSVDELKFSAIIMISVLFNRIPTQSKKVSQFYQTRVYKHAQDDKKVERSIRSFLCLIRGDISKLPGPGNMSPLEFISTRPPSISMQPTSSPTSSSTKQRQGSSYEIYVATFMKVFFAKSNFAICPNFFRDALIRLASIDLNEFSSFLLPKFLALNQTDPRFAVLLSTVPFLNHPDFLQKCFCAPSKEQLNTVNTAVQQTLVELIPALTEATKDLQKKITMNSTQILLIVDEAEHAVSEFLFRNNFTLFDYNINNVKLNEKIDVNPQNEFSLVYNLLSCIKVTFSNVNFAKYPELIGSIIEFSCANDQLISEKASSICIEKFNTPELQPLFIKETTKKILSTDSFEIRSKSLQLLSYSLSNLTYEISADEKETYFYEIESAALICLMSTSPYCRALALNLFKQINSLKTNSEILSHLIELNDSIIEKVKQFMMILNVPEKPFVNLPLIGHINVETACVSRHTDFWIVYFSEILNILIDLKYVEVLKIVNKALKSKFDALRKSSKKKAKQKDSDSENFNLIENDFDTIIFFVCFLNTFSTEIDFNKTSSEMSWYNEGMDKICKKALGCKSTKIKKKFIKSFRYLNWRVIPTVLNSTINIDRSLYSELCESLSIIIRNLTNFHKIFTHIFRVLIPYLNSFQTYFKEIQINGMTEIKWSDTLLKKLKNKEDMCINYCILISKAFQKMQNQVSEDEWPVSYRLVHVRFLTNWGKLPLNYKGQDEVEFNFEKLKNYAVNALIPILNSGTIFTNEFEFDLSMLDMLIQCKLSDWSVLSSVLYYHCDILLGEYIKQVLLKPQQQSKIFLNSIICTLQKFDNNIEIQQWGGALVLLAIFCYEQMYDQAWRFILQKILILFLKEKKNSENVQMINKANNVSFVITVFQFLTEQLIQFSFDVIRASQKCVVLKMIVKFLTPWIEKLRILPTQGFIIPGIPTKYRIFSVLTFFNEILSLSQILNNEQLEIFSQVWYNLLKSSDNNVIVLLLLFEYEKNDVKQKIFEKLLDKDPKMITKFLVKRCTFAFWYFIKTQRKTNMNFQDWMMKVLSRSFRNYKKEAIKQFVIAFHYSLLFIEKASDLFNTLLEVLNSEPIDSTFVWTSDIDVENTMGITSIIPKLMSKIKETNPKAIEKWSLEATRWAVACNDLRIAHRSLIILNCLDFNLDLDFTKLLGNAVLYFLNHFTPTYLSDLTNPTEQENDTENQKESDANFENVTFNLNLDEVHQFNSTDSYGKKQNPKGFYSTNSDLSSSRSLHMSSSEVDLNSSENDEISCYISQNETTNESNKISSLDDIELYVNQCFILLTNHFEEPEIGEFAFKFASCFIHFKPFLGNCICNFLPIFIKSYKNSILKDINVIIEAFIPYSKSIETNSKSQEMFIEIITKYKIPEFYLVASIFLQRDYHYEKEKEKKLGIESEIQFTTPFADVGITYDEIMSMKFDQKEIQNSLTIFCEILKNCSKQLTNSIFIVSNELLVKYGKSIDKTPFVPIYTNAIQCISLFKSAFDFISTLSVIASSIMSLKYEEWPSNSPSIDDLKSSISEITSNLSKPKITKNKVNSVQPIKLTSAAKFQISASKRVLRIPPTPPALNIARSSSKTSFPMLSSSNGLPIKEISGFLSDTQNDDQDEIIPITKCKLIKHLVGMIDQMNPPKIIPFAAHYEMIVGLTKEVKKKMKMKLKEEKLYSKRKSPSSLSIASQMMSNRSIAMTLDLQTNNLSSSYLNLNKLKPLNIRNIQLDLPDDEDDEQNDRLKFILPFEEFLKLDDDNSSEMSNSSFLNKRRKKKSP